VVTTADPASPTRRRWPRRVALSLALLVVVAFVGMVWLNRREFPYDGPDGTVAPGGEVTISDPGGTCGPLVVSIWRPSILGQWNQTHTGDVSGFGRDAGPWWKVWESETYDTIVPCFGGGETTFTLPDDLEAGTIAACDGDGNCARVEVS
jgi:hypothetical protein